MEKQGVIKPGLTPPEKVEETQQEMRQKSAEIAELDADFRKRAAETVHTATK